MGVVDVHGDQGPRALHGQIQRPFCENVAAAQRLLFRIPARLDRLDAPDRIDPRSQASQPLQDVGACRDEARPALARSGPTQRRSFPLARLGGHLDLDHLAGAHRLALAERQEARPAPAPQVDEGGPEGGVGLHDPTDAACAQPMLRRIVFPMDDQSFEPAIPHHDAPDLAGRVVQEDLDLAHRRQPAPASRLTVSGSGSPITAGWLPMILNTKAAAGPWMP